VREPAGTVTAVDAVFREASAQPRLESLPLSHLSIELGHLYMEDFSAGGERLRRHFADVAAWVETGRQVLAASLGNRTPRVSTCFLVDDYFTRFSSPAELVPQILDAAGANGLTVDYIARESGCAQADGVPLATLVEARLVADPPPGSNGSRPPPAVTGWLSNGQRSPATAAAEAMNDVQPWSPPSQNAVNRHSIFVDVELWSEVGGDRTWSCAFLAAVWQLLRLGVLRNIGEVVAAPRVWEGTSFPTGWDDLPPVTRVNPTAAPFSAYRTLSVLAPRFLPVEHAVRTILSQVAVDAAVLDEVGERARREKIELPAELVDRIDYVFAPVTTRRW
jgi:hypothetical protein